jgi:hypothetical protein
VWRFREQRTARESEAVSMMTLPRVYVVLPVSAFLALSSALGKQSEKSDAAANKAAASSEDRKAGFGRPEMITGTLLMVRPEAGIVALAVRGTSEPASTDMVVYERTLQDGDAVQREDQVSAFEGPGETDFNFRVAASTLIKIDGRQVALGELAALKGRQATIRFVPRREGNFALGIEVG